MCVHVILGAPNKGRGEAPRRAVLSGCCGFEGDAVSEGFEAPAETSVSPGRVCLFVPPIDAEIGVVAFVGVHVPNRDNHRVRGRDDRFRFPDPPR